MFDDGAGDGAFEEAFPDAACLPVGVFEEPPPLTEAQWAELAAFLPDPPLTDRERAEQAAFLPPDPPGLGGLGASGSAAVALDFATVHPAALSDGEVLDGIVGLDRVLSWAAARQARLLAEFSARRGDTRFAFNETRPSVISRYAPDEVGVALKISRGSARHRLGQASYLVHTLPAVLDAHERGLLDAGKVRVITDAVCVLPDELAAAVAARVLPRAPEQSTAQLRAAVAKAILAVDPKGANRRHRKARQERRVEVYANPEGMASLWALLSAPDARSAWEWLTRLARGLGAQDPRGMDARRADLLVALLTGKITLDDTTDDGDDGTAGGDEDGGEEGKGDGSSSSSDAGAGAGNADSDNAGGGGDNGGGGGVSRSIGRGLDSARNGHPAPNTPTADPVSATPAEPAEPAEPARPARERLRPVTPGKPLVQVVVPFSTLTGADDQPCELAGYGPIPADLARTIAVDAVWKRLLYDPPSGVLLDHGRTTYRPPAALTDFVTARDHTCRGPRCRKPAANCELDHYVPHPHGPTSESNMLAGCKHDHDLKHHGGWTVLWHPDRTLEWITPTGYRHTTRPYDYRPDPIDLEHGIPDPQPRRPAVEPDEDLPPF